MTKPLLTNSPTVQLNVGSDRKLRASALVSGDRENALDVLADGVWSGTVSKTACQVKQVAADAQNFPCYSGAAFPSTSEVVYGSADTDRDGLWTGTDPNKITFKRTGWYMVSSFGKWQTQSTFTQYGMGAWIARNGDENLPVAVYSPSDTQAFGSNIIGVNSAAELAAGAWHCLNIARFEAGEWITTKVVFQAVTLGAVVMVMSTNVFNGGCTNCGSYTVCQMSAALIRDA